MDKKEEKIILILASFEKELEEKLQETKSEVERVKYYEQFKINGIDFNDIFITTEKDVDGNISYHVYCGSSSNEIISINSNGEMDITPELQAYLDDINIENVIEENEQEKGRLKGISDKIKDKEIEEKIEEQEQEPEEQIEKDLSENEDLEISYYREIKDDNFDKRMNRNLNEYDEKGVAYSKKLNKFMLIGKKDGNFERVDGFEEAEPTMKTVFSIDEKGEQIEKKVPHALMKTNDDNKEVSITIDQYGYIEAATVDRLDCDERIEIQHEESGETSKGRTEKTLMDAIEAEGTEGLHNWTHENQEKLEKMKKDEISENENVEQEISTGKEHTYTDEEEKLIQDAAKNRAKMSVKGFKEILKDIPQTDGIEQRIDEAVEVAEQQSRGNNQ